MAGMIKQFQRNIKRNNLLSIAFVALLCSLSYFLGIWQHGGFSPSVTTTSVLSSTTCDPTTVSSSTALGLDFAAHHAANDSTFASPPPSNFLACDVKFSEYTPCEDVDRSLRFDRDRLIYRERHCPEKRELLKCLVPAPAGYRNPFPWPASRDVAWFANVPHKELSVEKAVQNWIRVDGDKFRFPGGGTMFPRGADAYIDDIDKLISLHDGTIRTALDTGCGVASWGAYLLSRNIITMSFAPRDTHEAQVQFALERGVPAMIGVLASNRLPYPSRAFDMAHCSRCLIPWHLYDGLYLIEIDRVLRPGGYWILSGPPINWKRHWKGWQRTEEDLHNEQNQIENVAKSLCWKKVRENGDLAIWQKPTNHIHCKMNRKVIKSPQFCSAQNPDAAWYNKMEACITPLPDVASIDQVAGGELKRWPERVTAIPPRISSGSVEGVTIDMFLKDTEQWKSRVGYYKKLISQLGQKGRYRNLLDMNAQFGGFAAALIDDPVWVLNMVPTIGKDTLGVIYERGLIGSYQDWCEAMSTYPRTYDLIHADSLFTLYKDRCDMEDILLEIDRILRPEGSVIFRDDVDILVKTKGIADRMKWQSQIVDHENGLHVREKLLLVVKSYWTAEDQNQSQ
ncbi:S-adenosyl-L-methionine-dependent methyltransferases superfamily protein [Rhynchospora pubera]|uniref:Methyltransferase n=1 Tax=Rhynchospora pubera TaxID=906938 RepID=A0AAV8CTY6_9POAL|nr:S-adenosyl-L-methionine-dependent methyltransferases superfamily protein [Rhynchospora pubera]